MESGGVLAGSLHTTKHLLPSSSSSSLLSPTHLLPSSKRHSSLKVVTGLLKQHISPTSNKHQIWQQLQHSQFPDFNNYLVFILARAKDLMMFDKNEKLLSRNPPNIHHVNNTSMELRCGVNGTKSDIVQACQRAAEDQANYFGNLHKGVLPETLDRLPTWMQATTLLELMTIRAFHSQILRRYILGTTIGFRIRRGNLTDILAILVFVARKVHRQWLCHVQCLPSALENRDQEVFGVMWMLRSSRILVHLQQLQKNNCTPSL